MIVYCYKSENLNEGYLKIIKKYYINVWPEKKVKLGQFNAINLILLYNSTYSNITTIVFQSNDYR